MFKWLASFVVLFLHNNSANVTAVVQQHSAGAATALTLAEGLTPDPVPTRPVPGNGGSNGGPS